ncbi:MAG: hypothetical protein L0221_04660 [Chloroflexi bacterium]|nr:hypothetical protein [Chloroflexota bacterium]
MPNRPRPRRAAIRRWVSILRKKRQPFARYEIRVTGDQRDDPHPHVFEQFRVIHVVEGDVDVEAVRSAIELSATRYCTVTGNLASGVAAIHHAYIVRDAAGEEHYGEVVVTGPNEGPDALGARFQSARERGDHVRGRTVRATRPRPT